MKKKNNLLQKVLEKFDNLGVYAGATLAPVGILALATALTPVTYMLVALGINVGAFLFARTYFDFMRKDLINDEERRISDNLHKGVNKNFNMLNNILLPLALFFATKSAMALALGFIAYDALSIGVENLLARIYVGRIDNKKVLSRIDDNYYYSQRNLPYFEKTIYKLTQRKIKLIEEREREEKKTLEQQNSLLDKKQYSEFEMFNKLYDELMNYPYDENEVPDDEYEVLLDKLKKIKASLEKDKTLIAVIDITTLETYVNAFIEMLNNFIEIDLDKNKDYNDKLTEIVKEFTNYLNRILTKIEDESKMKVDVSFNVLMDNIKNAE